MNWLEKRRIKKREPYVEKLATFGYVTGNLYNLPVATLKKVVELCQGLVDKGCIITKITDTNVFYYDRNMDNRRFPYTLLE